MKELNEVYIENLIKRADELISERNIPEAKEVLFEVLVEEPTYGVAHNHLGWIYTHEIVDLIKAEKHLKLAVKYAKGFPAAISNYAIFLLEANKLDELIKFVEKHQYSVGADKALLTVIKGNAFEVRGDLNMALKLYKEGKLLALNTGFMEQAKDAIERVHLKMNLIDRLLSVF